MVGALLLLIAAVSTSTASTSRVAVRITQALDVSAASAKAAFLDYTWRRGGGIPGLITNEGEARTLWPLRLEETLLPTTAEDTVRYTVTANGVLSIDLLPDTHSATVAFADDTDGGGCTLSWDVAFDVAARASFWEQFTQASVGAAAASLASHVATPLLYTRRMRLAASVDATLEQWLQFVWDEGGGLPLPPPLPLDRGDPSTRSGRSRVIVPPFLRERVQYVDAQARELRYTVDNPGWLTYQVHSHAGRVRFLEVDDVSSVATEMVWEVEVRPLCGCDRFVKAFTAAVVGTISRNFKVRLANPGACVQLVGLRGKVSSLPISVPADSWIGGVLAARLADGRSALEQTRSLVMPWTWGRSTDELGDSEEWTVSQMAG